MAPAAGTPRERDAGDAGAIVLGAIVLGAIVLGAIVLGAIVPVSVVPVTIVPVSAAFTLAHGGTIPDGGVVASLPCR